MNKADLEKNLDELLPDGKVQDDINQELAEAYLDMDHSVLDKDAVRIPVGVSITVVTKAFFKEYLDDVGFGTFKAMVALGKINKKKSGYIEAEHGFSTLYYSDAAQLITVDFHTEMR